ncbi:MAG: lipopolysaccharide biosynthesis protein [bacterium]|nr:lipopolysaccharide biosynthesis protein [bacterium]
MVELWAKGRVAVRSLAQKGFFNLLLALGAVQVISFTLKILLGRWLSSEDFARVSLVLETHSLLATVMTLALPTAMIRFGLAEGRLDEYLAGTMRLFGLWALITLGGFYLLLSLVAVFTDPLVQSWLYVTAAVAPGLALFNYLINWLSARRQTSARAWLVFSQRALYALGLGLGAQGGGLIGALWGFLGQGLLFTLALLGLFGRWLFAQTQALDLKALVRFSAVDSVGHLAGFASGFVLLWMAERRLELAQVSWLAMALSFTVVAKFFFASLYNVMYPYLMERNDRTGFVRQLRSVLGLGAVMGLGLALVAMWLVPYLIHWMLPPRFDAAGDLFRWLIWGESLIGLCLILEMALEVLGAVRLKAVALGAALALLTLLGWVLMARWGALGAVWAFLAAAGLRLVWLSLGCWWILRKPSDQPLF